MVRERPGSPVIPVGGGAQSTSCYFPFALLGKKIPGRFVSQTCAKKAKCYVFVFSFLKNEQCEMQEFFSIVFWPTFFFFFLSFFFFFFFAANFSFFFSLFFLATKKNLKKYLCTRVCETNLFFLALVLSIYYKSYEQMREFFKNCHVSLTLKGALNTILKFSVWLNFIHQNFLK